MRTHLNVQDRTAVEMKAALSSANGTIKEGPSKGSREEGYRYASSREAISSKYAAIREQGRQASKANPSTEKNISAAKVSLLDDGDSQSAATAAGPSAGLTSRWESMKNGFQTFKANMGARRFLPVRQNQETDLGSRASSHESLEDIFQRLKRPSVDHDNYSYEDDDGSEITRSGHGR